MTIKKLCQIVVMTTILIVQEEVLTVIPSVQLTFFLIMLYGATVGMGYGSLIVLTHVLIDNLIMSSFTVYTIIPMLIGYEITLLFGFLLKRRSEYLISVFGGLAAVIYCGLFIPVNIIVYEVEPWAYIVADIPFTLVMVTCNVLCIIFLWKPMYRILTELLDGKANLDPYMM